MTVREYESMGRATGEAMRRNAERAAEAEESAEEKPKKEIRQMFAFRALPVGMADFDKRWRHAKFKDRSAALREAMRLFMEKYPSP